MTDETQSSQIAAAAVAVRRCRVHTMTGAQRSNMIKKIRCDNRNNSAFIFVSEAMPTGIRSIRQFDHRMP